MLNVLLEHDPLLVLAAVLACVIGCHTTFRLAEHAHVAQGRLRHRRSIIAGIVAGASIWATHFLAMLALSHNMAMQYEIGMTMASILIAMAGGALANMIWMWRDATWVRVAGATTLAATIASMHFVGMAATTMLGFTGHDMGIVAASILLGGGLTVLAALVHRTSDLRRHLLATGLLAGGIAVIHFGSMTAMRMGTLCSSGASSGEAGIAIIVSVVTGAIILLALNAKRIDDRIDGVRRQADRLVEHASSHDALTGLPNRTIFHDRLGTALARSRRDGQNVVVLYIDLDGFKAVNDQFGHGRGDEALCEVSALLSASIRETDTIARMGGDEFVVIQEGVDEEQVHDVCARIMENLANAYAKPKSEIMLGASIGVAFSPRDTREADELVRMADLALYKAKEEGRGTTCFFERSMDEASRERRAFEADLRNALAKDEISIVFQPQMGADEHDIRGFEVLARWNHPVRGQVPPDRFIPLAERLGVICEIGEWVLEQACREAAGWQVPLRIAVNLSAIQITTGSLPQKVRRILAETGLDAERLELEVTETAILRDQETTLRVLEELKLIGVKIAMDDFGTGYSSLSSLHSFPFDKIKVDKSFVSSIENDGKASSIVKAVIGLGRSLDLPIVAEGVENAMQLELLQKERCTEIQGYLVGRPLPADAWLHITHPGADVEQRGEATAA